MLSAQQRKAMADQIATVSKMRLVSLIGALAGVGAAEGGPFSNSSNGNNGCLV